MNQDNNYMKGELGHESWSNKDIEMYLLYVALIAMNHGATKNMHVFSSYNPVLQMC